MAERYVALLRGINLLAHKRLPMKDLAAIFEKVGCAEVRTYIASGNVVFAAKKKVADAVTRTVPDAIAKKFGFTAPVVLRSAAEMARLVAENPFVREGADVATLHVMFLADAPSPAAVVGLDVNRSPGDEFRVVGKEIYLRLPNGVAKSKLNNAFFDSKLKTVSTGRNWRTVNTLLEMVHD